jgi:hypothetical protein
MALCNAMSPVAPKSYEIRSRDFEIGENLNLVPGDGKFPVLRTFADKWNVLRTIIDTKKGLMSAAPWSIKPDPKPGESKKDLRARATADSADAQPLLAARQKTKCGCPVPSSSVRNCQCDTAVLVERESERETTLSLRGVESVSWHWTAAPFDD